MRDILFNLWFFYRTSIETTIDRSKLRYADTVGQGWFGWVIRGFYERRQVTVQVLREEADAEDRERFLKKGLSWQRRGNHPNIVSLVGMVIDRPPWVTVLDTGGGSSDLGDLKTFLLNASGIFQFNVIFQFVLRKALNCQDYKVSEGYFESSTLRKENMLLF